MRQQAATGGQPQNSLPNGPLAEPPHHHAGLANASPVNHSTNRPPCVTQPTANGSCSSSPSAGLPGHLDKNHALGLGGGGASNGNVPYLQQNSLPHNCTATSHPSTSSTTSSPSRADETWKSQQRNNSTQVSFRLSMFVIWACFTFMSECISFFPDFVLRKHYFLYFNCMFFVLPFLGASKRSRFTFGRSQWRTPFLFLLLFFPSDLFLFLWHSKSGRSFLWALHCLLLCLLSIPHVPSDYTQPLVFTSPLRYYLRGSHQRCHAFSGQ